MNGVYLLIRMNRYDGMCALYGAYKTRAAADADCDKYGSELVAEEKEIWGKDYKPNNPYEWYEVHFMKFRDAENG